MKVGTAGEFKRGGTRVGTSRVGVRGRVTRSLDGCASLGEKAEGSGRKRERIDDDNVDDGGDNVRVDDDDVSSATPSRRPSSPPSPEGRRAFSRCTDWNSRISPLYFSLLSLLSALLSLRIQTNELLLRAFRVPR